MKQDKHRFLRKRRGRKPGKAGSSLALVMMIGAALVIWVMCIMPLMTTTGTTAIQTEEKYDDYLESRSSIEYCKSELEKCVSIEQRTPYPFAVVKNEDVDGNVTYTAHEKKAGEVDTAGYNLYVNAANDTPKDNADGKKVVAICAVEWKSEDNRYEITITTYHGGKQGMTYTLYYTPNGSLLIYPEAYGKNQALPLSDFVVVDGIMGGKKDGSANQIWKSSLIEQGIGHAVGGDNGTGDFTEELLPWVMEPSADYANSQEYPAVFKKTAEAALLEEGGSEVGTPITDGDFTDVKWAEPQAVSAQTNTPGSIWITGSNPGDDIQVWVYKDEAVDITGECTIYLNGQESDSKKVPTQEGYYTVTIDYEGDSDAKILPVSGLRMAKTVGEVGTYKQSKPSSAIISVVQDGDKYTVTMSGENGVRYGYRAEDEAEDEAEVHWNSVGDNTFEDLEAGETYYFYAYRPAAMVDDGNGYVYYKSNSNVQYVGRIFPKKFATELTNGGQYLVLGKNVNDYSAMTANGTDLSAVSLSSRGIKEDGDFFIYNGEKSVDDIKWTVQEFENSSNKWSFQKGEKSYLSIIGKYERVILFFYDWNLWTEVGETADFHDVSIIDESGRASVSHYFEEGKRNNITAYLSIADNLVSAQNEKSYVYLLNVPKDKHLTNVTAPTVTGILGGNGMVYANNNDVIDYVKGNGIWTAPDETERQGSDVTVNAVYANGTKCIYGTEAKWLNAGEYYLTADITVDGTQYCVDLDRWAVGKGSLPANLSIKSIDMDDNDELTVKVTATGWNIDIDKYVGGTRWFGYQKLDDSGNPVDDFKWYPATGADPETSADELFYTFRLPYGTYNFAVREYGCSNYNGVESAPEEKTIVPTPVTLSAEQINEFVFTYDAKTKTTVWYKLPMATVTKTAGTENEKKIQILPYRVKLVFGTPGDSVTWSDTLTDDARYYGVKITASNFETDALKLAKPIGITSEGGHTTSMMRGKSLYFMGQGGTSPSINTYGNSIYLTTDVLVLGSDIDGGGSVIVSPYSSGTDKCTLFFNAGSDIKRVNSETGVSTVVFKSRYLYELKPNADLCNPTFGDSGKVREIGSIAEVTVRELFKQGTYDEPNLDIAYASEEQLAHIISSETIGWTKNGVLSGVDGTDNATNKKAASYVVCAYVNQINADGSPAASVSHRANRVMLVGRTFDGISALNVPCSLTFDTRYLSIDAQTIVQNNSGASFNINNLGQDEDFLQLIIKELGVSSYHSKTLQVDYEQPTTIQTVSNGEKLMKQQICRYGITVNGSFVGADLFGPEDDAHEQNKAQPLMVTYTTDEINGWYSSFWDSDAEFYVTVVDRYVSIVPDGENGSKTIKINASSLRKLNLYANYIYFGPTVEEISLYTGIDKSSFKISSQESGYTTNDYLGLFKTYSADSYNGTLIYIANPDGLKCQYYRYTFSGLKKDRKPVVLPQGFYYIKADKGLTSITQLLTEAEQVDENSLSNFSVYIKKDGSFSSGAFVDPGIYDNTATGTGGFSGGNVG